MINREEAKSRALQNVERRYAIQLADLDSKVQSAADAGKFEVDIDGVLEDDVQSYLVSELGYTLTAKIDYRGRKEDSSGLDPVPVTTISWSDNCANNTTCK